MQEKEEMQELNCEHDWVVTDKLPVIGKKWIVDSNGRRREVYCHVYKCSKCNIEKTLSQEEARK